MKRPLDPYVAKRKFSQTPEPAPRERPARKGPLLFVVQKHAARRLHYDFRLELDGVLKSWAVPKGPSLDPAEKRMAVETEDHPFDYASFEGVIPEKQYGAGNVIVWDTGVYSPDEDGEYSFGDRERAEERVRQELAAGKLSFFLRGEKLKGSFALVRTSTDKQWLLIKHKDRFVSSGSDVLARAQSVLSGYHVEDLSPGIELPRLDAERLIPCGTMESMPAKLLPMLAEVGEGVRSDPNYLYEPKLDGYRTIAYIHDGKVRLESRRGLDYTPVFPEIVTDLAAQAVDRMVLDGEIVAMGPDGRPSFNALQNRAQLKTPQEIAKAQRESPVVLVCFDILHFAGVNLRNAPYVDRHRYLAQCLLPTAHVQVIHNSPDAERLYDAALAAGFEGIVGKRKDSVYKPGQRVSTWLKMKATRSAEFVIGGYTKGKGDREPLGALLLGYWDGNDLRYVGHVGSGLTGSAVQMLLKRVAGLTRKNSPFVNETARHRPITWLEPKLVAEVTFANWSEAGNLLAPVFVRLRDDLDPMSIRTGPPKRGSVAAAAKTSDPRSEIESVLDQLNAKGNQLTLLVGDAKIRLTNLDRVYWPAPPSARRGRLGGEPPITKRDLIRYLAAVSPYMLPHLKDRPLTMIRMPEGIEGERFYQKHWEQTLPDFVERVTVYSEHKADRHAYLMVNNLPTLLWLGQNGTLEFHVWHSRACVGPDAVSKSTDYSSSLEALEASVLNYPDWLVFDIDPYIYSGKEPRGAEPELNKRGFEGGRRVAFWLRALLKEMSLDALVKTSGKTGLHVFVPIERTVTFDEARHLCEMVGRHLLREHPKEITMEWAVEKRTGKIFIDYNMNVRGKTLNAAYSPRGVPGAPVSMPLSWEELEAAEPMDFTIRNVVKLLERQGDRWHDAYRRKHNLARALARSGDA